MIIEKGIATKTIDYGDGMVETTIVNVIRKTQNSYTEILANKQYSVTDNGNQTICENENDYSVYVGKTIEQVLTIKGLSGGYTWTTPLTEV